MQPETPNSRTLKARSRAQHGERARFMKVTKKLCKPMVRVAKRESYKLMAGS